MLDFIIDFLLMFIVVIISIVLHELAHGFVALLNGDKTAKERKTDIESAGSS